MAIGANLARSLSHLDIWLLDAHCLNWTGLVLASVNLADKCGWHKLKLLQTHRCFSLLIVVGHRRFMSSSLSQVFLRFGLN